MLYLATFDNTVIPDRVAQIAQTTAEAVVGAAVSLNRPNRFDAFLDTGLTGPDVTALADLLADELPTTIDIVPL